MSSNLPETCSQNPPADITRLLRRWTAGDTGAAARVLPLVYGDMRRIAAGFARRERPDHTLQPTALVHEAYLELFGERAIQWKSRAHFLSVAARVMRHILVDHSRRHGALKRGGGEPRVSLSGDVDVSFERAAMRPSELTALDDALTDLARFDADGAWLVELRFFGGLSLEETAACLGFSRKTAVRRWRRAKAWLYAELKERCGSPR